MKRQTLPKGQYQFHKWQKKTRQLRMHSKKRQTSKRLCSASKQLTFGTVLREIIHLFLHIFKSILHFVRFMQIIACLFFFLNISAYDNYFRQNILFRLIKQNIDVLFELCYLVQYFCFNLSYSCLILLSIFYKLLCRFE